MALHNQREDVFYVEDENDIRREWWELAHRTGKIVVVLTNNYDNTFIFQVNEQH
jgi:hypothetical protein